MTLPNIPRTTAPEEYHNLLANVPPELQRLGQWVCWSDSLPGKEGRKVPVQVNGREARSNDPTTWTTLDKCLAVAGRFSGVGFVFADHNHLVGIDLDGCRCPETGDLAPWAAEILDRFPGYAEVSPSATGVKLWVSGDRPADIRKNTKLDVEQLSPKVPGIEVYDQTRYFTVTGQVLDGHRTIQPATPDAWSWLRTSFPAVVGKDSPGAPDTAGRQRRPAGPPQPANVLKRASRYLAKMPEAVSGQKGHYATFSAACVLVLGFDLPPDQAFELLANEYNPRCQPPWSDWELLRKCHEADKKPGERGRLLHASRSPDHELDHFLLSLSPPPPDVPVEPYHEPTGDVVDLDAWRDQMKAARLATLGQDGLFLDTSPTGAGKSHADLEAMRAAGRSLTVLPDHANCQETAAKLRNAGLDAAAFPPLNKDTCANLDEAQAALSAGLAVGAAVCPGCPCLLACQYHQETEAAERSDHAVATHKRAALSFPRLAADRGFVAVHEDARDLLAPTVGFRGRDLANLQDALAAGRTREDNSPSPDPEMHAWLVHLTDLVDQLLDRLDAAETSTPLDLDLEADQPPPNWQRRLWQVLREDGSLSVNGDALRAVVALATGGLRLIAVQVDNPKGPGGADQVVKSLVAVWWTVLPAGMPIWFEDATATAETLGRLTNQRVQDLTPAGRLAVQVPAVQVPADITRGTSTDRVASWLRGILAARPHARRVGLIGHRVHVKQLVGRRTPLDEDTRSRIHRSAYFGQGPDRGSNTWLDCDLLVVLGTPRVPPASVRRDLIRQGQVEAAGDKDAGRWGPRHWQGRTTAGDLVVVQGAGYAAPAWAAAARDQVRANLVQAVGRGRGVLANGVPVVVVSNEPLDLPLDPGAVQQVPERVREAAELVRRRCSENAKEIHLGESEQPRGVQTAEIAKLLGVSPSTASERLAAAAAAGLVVRSDRRKGGWLPPPPPEPDQESDPETLGSGDESPVTVVGLDNLVQVVAALPLPGPPDETDQDRLTSTLDAAVAVVERLDATLDNLVRGAAQMLPDEPDEPGGPPPPQGNLVAFWRIHGPPRFSEDESTLDLRDSDAGFRAV